MATIRDQLIINLEIIISKSNLNGDNIRLKVSLLACFEHHKPTLDIPLALSELAREDQLLGLKTVKNGT
jgi:hypothetical protein